MNIDTALEKIYSLKQFSVKLGLENITNLLNHLGNPHKELKTIHVAGSNGKGSTCSFLASILMEYGYKVGLYTSPHLVRFNERIRINGIEINDEDIIEFLDSNKSYIDKYSPTFFEITTALAFNYFAENKVDFAIIETGLGGRLDATNVLDPLASVITSISLEHSHILGNTLEKIAYEKGCIIKKGIPTFIGELPVEAENKIETIAKERASELFKLTDSLEVKHHNFDLKLNNDNIEITHSGLKGEHQLKNGALAIKVINNIFNFNDYKLFQTGLDNVVKNSGIQGRYEKIGSNNNIIFDAAHNSEGIEIFLKEFKKEFPNYLSNQIIFGAMNDKNISEMLSLIQPYFQKIHVTSTNYERAATADEIRIIAEKTNINVSIINEPEKLVKHFLFNNLDEVLVVIGSIYLMGDIKRKLGEEN
jgi:dihydrofolate synthase/folylpolyglutamate synthase